jgi:hypothetical protein
MGVPIAYMHCFNSIYGKVVIQDLLDNVYCTVYEGNDPIEMATHNGRRSAVHEILKQIDLAVSPQKYVVEATADNGVSHAG